MKLVFDCCNPCRLTAAGGDCDPHTVTVPEGETTLHIACMLADGSVGAIKIMEANAKGVISTPGPPCCETCVGKGNDYDKISAACDGKQSCAYTSTCPGSLL